MINHDLIDHKSCHVVSETQASDFLMGELSAEPKCLVGGSQNSALHCTASGMVGDFPAKSYGGLRREGIYLYL